ncbi:unnamed protein product [Medioppia subpectinata]|uniref:Nitric oxide synthase-interacting protein homolog n=1 Tax=Medioppia subpectinata TaxID=1979941 RepID=A0A7R9L799_9ACAR|nr:unnamed protein product [Medioppia subpectinata]CAG2116482.1 unnamed protein product [Medioppia subpectinata]
MTRHARNNTAGAVYSYHERQRDAGTSGYGTQRLRLSKDAIKDFDACNLTLQPARHPVLTPEGFLYDKESIIEYIIHQKRENARKLKEYEKQKKREESDAIEAVNIEHSIKTLNFLKTETTIVNAGNRRHVLQSSAPSSSSTASVGEVTSSVGSGISNMTSGRDKGLPSFWVPSMTPQSSKTKLKKPENIVLCPMSGRPLKANQLIDIHFTPTNDSKVFAELFLYLFNDCIKSAFDLKGKYKCAVTHDVLHNSVLCAVLKTSGTVVTMECVEKLIRKDMLDPINGQKLKEEDIVPLQMGGTGYAAANDQLLAAVKRPVMMA